MRYVAFPSNASRLSLQLDNIPSQTGNWSIIGKPTESGVYLLEATEEAIAVMRELYDGLYVFMEDFE